MSLIPPYSSNCEYIFAHSIRKCSYYGANKWGIIEFNPGCFRLVFGNVMVSATEPGKVWLALDKPNDQEKAMLEGMAKRGCWKTLYEYKVLPAIFGFYNPTFARYDSSLHGPIHDITWPYIKPLHDRYFPKLSKKYDHLQITLQKFHTDEILVFMERLKKNLPRPDYS